VASNLLMYPPIIFRLLEFEQASGQYAFWERIVTPDELFEKFPDLLFSSFRNQMLLGKVPAETVRRVLAPLLSDFYEVMLQLPASLQTDFENILRIYPDVAEQFGVWIKPPIVESLRCFSRYRLRGSFGGGAKDLELDMAAEDQSELEVAKKSFVKEGQGFFTTDRGNPVYLEFFYSEGDDCASFEYKPPHLEIEIHICGICASTLSPGKPKRKIPVDNLVEILKKCVSEVEIQIIERVI